MQNAYLSNGVGVDILSDNNIIFDNIILNNLIGINISKNSKNNDATLNTISNSRLYAISIRTSNYNNISRNNISLSGFYGIYLSVSDNNIIFGNTVSECDFYGVRIKASEDIMVYGNTIYNNNRGVYLCCGSKNNIIYHNNFKQNTEWNARDDGNNSWDNGYPSCGNYWDDYNGTDTDNNGIGDISYNILDGYGDANNEDRYPLMKPYGITKLSFGPGLRFPGSIKNIGNNTAFNVQWRITIEGGFILLGRESSGTLPKPLLPDDECAVKSKLIFGFGRIVITVELWADNVPYNSQSRNGMLLLFFIMLL